MNASIKPYFQAHETLEYFWLHEIDFQFCEYRFRVQQLFDKQELISYRNLADHLILEAWIENLPEDPLNPSILSLMASSIHSFICSLRYPQKSEILSCRAMQRLLNQWINSLGKHRILQKKTMLISYKKFKKSDAFVAFRNSYPKRYKPES